MAPAEPTIRYTRTADVRAPGARLDVALPRALVVVEAKDLSPALRSAAARAAGLDPALVDQLAAAGLPLPLASADSAAGAQAKAAGLSAEIPGVQVVDPERTTPNWAMAAPAGAFLLSFPLLMLALWPLVPVVWILAIGALVAGLSAGSKRRAALREAMQLTGGEQQAGASESARGLLQRVQGLRAHLGGLHELVARDLGESLSEIEADLGALSRRERAEGLDAVAADYARIGQSLHAAELAIAGPDRDAGPDAAERLQRQVQALRATAAEVGGPGRTKR